MSNEDGYSPADRPVSINQLSVNTASLDVAGQVSVSIQVPSYISYAHFQNQELVGREHGVIVQSERISEPKNGDYRVKISLYCQGQEISKPSYLDLRTSLGSKAIDQVPYKLNGDFLFEVREATPALFKVSLLDGDDELAFAELDTQIFPPNLWSFNNLSLASGALMLSVFVRPRDPNLDALLTRAREIKGGYKSPTGQNYSPTSAGYQSDDQEILAEVKALYEAVQASQIHYSNPPGSLDWNIGQLIRSTEEILDSRAATCLDSTTLFASLLENIGIHPVIVLVPDPGHAFVGYVTKSGLQIRPSSSIISAEEALQLMRRDPPALRFVETTKMCASPEQMSFEAAMQLAEDCLAKEALLEDESLKPLGRQGQGGPYLEWLIVDVLRARRRGYRPLAAKVKNSDGTTSIIEYEINDKPFELNIQVDVAKVGSQSDNSPVRVKYWKSQLLDMTFNNPLLNMHRRRASQVRLLIPAGRLGSVEDVLQQSKGELKLRPAVAEVDNGLMPFANEGGAVPPQFRKLVDSAFTDEETLFYEGVRPPKGRNDFESFMRASTNKIRNLHKSSKDSIEETGTNNLYMTFGSLRWKRKDSNSNSDPFVVSPLILIPVTLRAIDKGRLWAVALDDSNDLATNETLALKLFQDWGISIPALTAPVEDAAGIDIPGLVQAVQIAIDEAKQTTWQVQQDATIGTYDFSTFHMWKDLNDNWQKLSEAPLVKHLIETDGDSAYQDPMATDGEISEEELDAELSKVPVPADGSQLRAVIRSLKGESFIIQGPPGTGKSQTITNLLARNLQEGKKVLFMSEKPAALQVVKDRLDEIRLGSFVLDLHSKNTSSEAIRGQLLAALDASPKVDKVGIEAEQFDFGVATKALSKYPERLHRVNETFGHSVYSVRDTLLKLATSESLRLTRSCLNFFTGETLLKFKSKLADIADIGEQSGIASKNAWSFSNIMRGPSTELRESLTPFVRQIVSLGSSLTANKAANRALCNIISPVELEKISALPTNLPNKSDLQLLSQLDARQKLVNYLDLLKLLSQRLSIESAANQNFGSIPISDLEAEYRLAQDAKLFRKKKLTTLAEQVSEYWLGALSADGIGTVLQKARDMYDLGRKVADSSIGIPGIEIAEASALYTGDYLQQRLVSGSLLYQLIQAFDESSDSAMRQALELEQETRVQLVSLAKNFMSLIGLVEADENSINLWLAGKSFGERLAEVLRDWDIAAQDGQYNSLLRWGLLLEIVVELKLAGQLDAYNQILAGEIEFSEVPGAFDRARLSYLLEKLIDEHELQNFSSGTQISNITKLRRSSEALRIYNRDTIASSVVSSRTFDPTAVAGKAGALRSEISKQRGRLPVRQLMKKYWETITEITPCVAASPDSVARFLDVNLAQFDLVVFDEASQLRVPNSIGALGRGKAAIIVGDSMQMPPTNFFASGGSEDDDDDALQLSQPDVESILTMAEFSKLPRVRLTWHYRSQDEALIRFSNANYYQNELASFPSPSKKINNERAVIFKKVKDAEYIRGKGKAQTVAEAGELETEEEELQSQERNTNAKEAQEVVDHILNLYEELGDSLNLGVVTMNESQRKKIAGLLEAQASAGLQKILDSKATSDYLFVRPLEKVQGDERDIIILSIGFAAVPDPKSESGYKLPQNFGPLTKAGSEKRLNVAITRARKRVYVFCSFDPSLMRISETSSQGMKDLKAYLSFAESETNELLSGGQTTFEEPDRHKLDVAKAIQGLGYEVSQDVGLSNFKVDIAVKNPKKPGEYILAILLDGPSWKQRPAANDRDVLPVGILEKNMGWKGVERIWLPVWIKDPEGEKARIKERLDELQKSETEQPATLPQTQLTEVPDLDELILSTQKEENAVAAISIDKTGVGINIDDIEPFAEIQPQLVTSDKTMLQHTNHPEIKRVIEELIGVLTSIEGPVHPDRAANHVAKCFGLSHVQSARSAAIIAAIPRARFTRDDEGFIFPEGETISSYTSWKRKDKGEPRDIILISLTEITNAMRTLCDKTHGMEKEELLRQTMRAFGPKTLSAPIRKRLEIALNFAEKRKVIVLDGDHYIVPGQ